MVDGHACCSVLSAPHECKQHLCRCANKVEWRSMCNRSSHTLETTAACGTGTGNEVLDRQWMATSLNQLQANPPSTVPPTIMSSPMVIERHRVPRFDLPLPYLSVKSPELVLRRILNASIHSSLPHCGRLVCLEAKLESHVVG
jgi:hypothetical protein